MEAERVEATFASGVMPRYCRKLGGESQNLLMSIPTRIHRLTAAATRLVGAVVEWSWARELAPLNWRR